MRVLVVANTGDDDAGYVGERLIQRGFELTVRHRDTPELPTSLDGYDLAVILGSDWSVYWDHVRDNVEREAALIQDAAKNEVPVLGICYGGQLMSHALGGSVEVAHEVEIGWFSVSTDDERLAPPGPWFEYHIDKFTPPDGARVIATSASGPQAYLYGRMLALQFHPEVSPEIVRRWGSTGGADADKYGIDFDAIYAESDERDARARKQCHDLVDAFLDSVAFTT
ncbi:MAG: type 1 glutamine amidotransferase [Candidatus Nanopelagicales bacterium]